MDSTADRRIRVLIAEDMHLLREALVRLVSDEPDMVVPAQAARGDEIVPAALEHRPHVAVLDIGMPGADGLDVAAELHERLPGCRVLILTGMAGPGRLHRALRAGVAGFLPKDVSAEVLTAAIRTVAAGGRVIDDEVALTALAAAQSPLTQRETEVLRLSATGAPPAEIAAALFITYGTARNYLTSAVAKLAARNRIDAIRIATESGWI